MILSVDNGEAKSLSIQLARHDIDYCVADGIACNMYGYSRPTTDVDVILTQAGLDKLREKIVFSGLVPRFRGAKKSFVEPRTKVGVNVILSGQFPGDGKPKGICFPDPSCAETIGGVKVLPLHKLIELK